MKLHVRKFNSRRKIEKIMSISTVLLIVLSMHPFLAIHARATSSRALIINAKWNDVPSAYYPTVSTALEQLGIPYDILNPESLTLNALKNYDFAFIPGLGPYIPPEDLAIYNPDTFADMVEQYVIEGGSLLFCPGHGIVYSEEARDPPVFDVAFIENHRIVDFKVTDDNHPIMEGPYRTFNLGEQIYAHEIDTQSFPADASTLGVFVDKASGTEYGKGIVAFQRGNGKVVASGLQIGWTSSGPALSNGVPAQEWIKFTKNAITWLLTPLPESLDTPLYMQWYFWTNIAMGITTGVFALTTAYYRKKAFIPKKPKITPAKPVSEKYKACPNCGANLPADSKFCGKCGASLE